MNQTDTIEIPAELRLKCNNNALHSYGKTCVFENRAKRFHNRLIILKWLGIAVPILVYGIIASFNLSSEVQKFFLTSASIISTLLLVISIWSLVADWEKQYSKSMKAQIDFLELCRLYRELGTTTLKKLSQYTEELSKLDILMEKADQLAIELTISEEEKRMGMRCGLREFQRKCASCAKIPKDIVSTNCPVCGNFKIRRI
jgi:mobilome CxxCx(11)CxxC protein